MKIQNNTTNKNKGFTLIEVLIVIGILVIIVGIAVAAIANSKSDSELTGSEGNAKTLNDAITRAKLAGDDDPRIIGETANDTNAAAQYLSNEGYID